MIVTEFYRTREDGVRLVRTYSDQGMMIHGGFPEGDYEESIDPEDANRVFTETNIPVPLPELTDTQALNVIMGRGMIDGPENGSDVPAED